MKKVLSAILKVFVFLVFAAGLFVLITVISTKGQSVPSFFGYSFLNVSTPSMAPKYPVGAVVITRKVDAATLKTGDVITFYSQDPKIKGIPNTHRIYSVEKEDSGEIYFVTKGDNNDIPDQYPVLGKNIIGVVTSSIPVIGKAISLLNSRIVLFFVLILPLVVLMIFEAKNIGKTFKDKNGKTDEEVPEVPEDYENPIPPAPGP